MEGLNFVHNLNTNKFMQPPPAIHFHHNTPSITGQHALPSPNAALGTDQSSWQTCSSIIRKPPLQQQPPHSFQHPRASFQRVEALHHFQQQSLSIQQNPPNIQQPHQSAPQPPPNFQQPPPSFQFPPPFQRPSPPFPLPSQRLPPNLQQPPPSFQRPPPFIRYPPPQKMSLTLQSTAESRDRLDRAPSAYACSEGRPNARDGQTPLYSRSACAEIEPNASVSKSIWNVNAKHHNQTNQSSRMMCHSRTSSHIENESSAAHLRSNNCNAIVNNPVKQTVSFSQESQINFGYKHERTSSQEIVSSVSVADTLEHQGSSEVLEKRINILEVPFHPWNDEFISRNKDQDWLNKWLNGKQNLKALLRNEFNQTGKDAQSKHSSIRHRSGSSMKLSGVHGCVARYRELLAALQQPPDGVAESAVKDELDDLSRELLDPSYQNCVRKLVEARRKKRARQRRLSKQRREKWRLKGEEIDAVRERTIKLEKEKQTAARLREEADCVLREVRSKQQEAEGLATLVLVHRDLRQHRCNRGEDQGHVTTEGADAHFAAVMDGLEQMLQQQMEEYQLEERTLRAMMIEQRSTQLEHQAAKDSTSDSSSSSSSAALLQAILFGKQQPSDAALYASYTSADESAEMLYSRRRAWDQHLTNSDEGTGVPVGWVIPPENPAKEWIK